MTTNQVVERLLQALEGADKIKAEPWVAKAAKYIGTEPAQYGYLKASVRCLIEELAVAK